MSVSDKTGLVEFVKGLQAAGWQIIATGGTQKLLEESGVKTIGISEVTGFPEICDGRVKTLHPKVHGALLARRDEPSHMAALAENGIEFISVNTFLYHGRNDIVNGFTDLWFLFNVGIDYVNFDK